MNNILIASEIYMFGTHLATLVGQRYAPYKQIYSGFLFGMITDMLSYALLVQYTHNKIYWIGFYMHFAYTILFVLAPFVYEHWVHTFQSGFVFKDNKMYSVKYTALTIDTLLHCYALYNLTKHSLIATAFATASIIVFMEYRFNNYI